MSDAVEVASQIVPAPPIPAPTNSDRGMTPSSFRNRSLAEFHQDETSASSHVTEVPSAANLQLSARSSAGNRNRSTTRALAEVPKNLRVAGPSRPFPDAFSTTTRQVATSSKAFAAPPIVGPDEGTFADPITGRNTTEKRMRSEDVFKDVEKTPKGGWHPVYNREVVAAPVVESSDPEVQPQAGPSRKVNANGKFKAPFKALLSTASPALRDTGDAIAPPAFSISVHLHFPVASSNS